MVSQNEIAAVEFRILPPEYIKKMAVVKVVTPDLYDADGYPIDGSLMDLRMGSVDPALRCRTCGAKVKDCPGHFGYIELARPVIHVFYAPVVHNMLRSTCHECGRIRLEPDVLEKYEKKLKEAKSESDYFDLVSTIINRAKRKKECPYCGAPRKNIKFKKPTFFLTDEGTLPPTDIREWLSKIPDSDLKFLGLNPNTGRPEWMVLTVLPVPPVSARPSITLDNGQRSEDDLTHKLNDIIRTNQRLFENINAGAPKVIIDDLWDLLQYHVTTLFTNSISQVPPATHRSGRPLKTLADRISGKEGRFRHYLLGKRVNFSARTVISPDPNVCVTEVGVPQSVAKTITVPEYVTEWNIQHLRNLVRKGDNYPGAKYVITPLGIRKRITDETRDVIADELDEGYIVERHIVDGDVVLFNRQPSLHRMSMMGHRVKVLPGKTFRINPAVAQPYNADFDGDEMNLHVPQTPEAIVEVMELMDVKKNIISPRFGKPIIGAKQDHVSGCYLLTQDDTVLTREEAAQLLASVGVYDLPSGDTIKGKDIFSMILPKDLNFEGQSMVGKVKIEKGKLVSGVVDNKIIGSGGSLLAEVYRRYGPDVVIDFIDKVSKLGINFIMLNGFTVLPSDTDLPEKASQEIREILRNAEKKVRQLLQQYADGELEAHPGRTVEETLEHRILMVLNRARNQHIHIIRDSVNIENHTLIMTRAGSRGSLFNVALIAASVGQASLRGSRINKGFFGRTLPLFEKGDLGSAAHGFISRGYKEGLTPYEFFFNAISGRDSLSDTSMRTPKSGYLQRRMVNALQDLKVKYDGTVRDDNDSIVQFVYGEDGTDPAKLILKE